MTAPPSSSIRDSTPIQLFIAAFLLRVAVFLVASHHYHIPLAAYANKGDGESYLHVARAMLGDSSAVTEYDRRVFPGYPALIVAAHGVGLSLPWGALGVDWVSAGIAAAAGYLLFGEGRIGWAMLFLLPHYLGNSSLAMSEAPLLAFTLAGLVMGRRGWPIAGGVLLGCAGMIRPMACFAAMGLIVSFAMERRWWAVVRSALAAAIVVGAGVIAMHVLTGDALLGVRVYRDSPQAYEGRIFEWPFYSLIHTPGREAFSAGFMAYIYIHVGIVLAGCGVLAGRVVRRSGQPLDGMALAWLMGNTLFQLCIGSHWGFRHFPRFAIPAEPALFWALAPFTPRRKWVWWAGIAGVFWLAVVSVGTCK